MSYQNIYIEDHSTLKFCIFNLSVPNNDRTLFLKIRNLEIYDSSSFKKMSPIYNCLVIRTQIGYESRFINSKHKWNL